MQGSLRQFLQNAAALAGPNAMRFVPAMPTNAGAPGAALVRIAVSTSLPPIGDAATTIDATAYDLADGTTPLDANPGTLGSGGTVGVDGLALAPVERPELEVLDTGNVDVGLSIAADSVTVRHIAVSGFGDVPDNDNEASIRTTNASNWLIESCIVGASAGAFVDPAAGATGDDVRIRQGGAGILRNNLIGFSSGNVWRAQPVRRRAPRGNEGPGSTLGDPDLHGILFDHATARPCAAIWCGRRADRASTWRPPRAASIVLENNTVRATATAACRPRSASMGPTTAWTAT